MDGLKKILLTLCIATTVNCSQNPASNTNAGLIAAYAAAAQHLAARASQPHMVGQVPLGVASQVLQFNQYNPVFNVNPVYNYAPQPSLLQTTNQLLAYLTAAQLARQMVAPQLAQQNQFQHIQAMAAATPHVYMPPLPPLPPVAPMASVENAVQHLAHSMQQQVVVNVATTVASNSVNRVAAAAHVDRKAATESVPIRASAVAAPNVSHLEHNSAPAAKPREIVCKCNKIFNSIEAYKDHVMKEYVKIPESECTRDELMAHMRGYLKKGTLEGLTFGKLSNGNVYCLCGKIFNNDDLWEGHVIEKHMIGQPRNAKSLNEWRKVDNDDLQYLEHRARERKRASFAAPQKKVTHKRKKDDSTDESDSDDLDSIATARASGEEIDSDEDLPAKKKRKSTPKTGAAAAGGGDGEQPLRQNIRYPESVCCPQCAEKKEFKNFYHLVQHLRLTHKQTIKNQDYKSLYEKCKASAAFESQSAAGAGGGAAASPAPSVRFETPSEQLVCKCDQSFKSLADYKEHVLKDHVKSADYCLTEASLMLYVKDYLKKGRIQKAKRMFAASNKKVEKESDLVNAALQAHAASANGAADTTPALESAAGPAAQALAAAELAAKNSVAMAAATLSSNPLTTPEPAGLVSADDLAEQTLADLRAEAIAANSAAQAALADKAHKNDLDEWLGVLN